MASACEIKLACVKKAMTTSIFDIFFRPTGVMNAKAFLIGVAGLSVFVFATNMGLRTLGPGALKFTIGLIFPFLALYVIYCVYGKRLHDMGFSVWPLTGLITAEILVMIGLMLAFGGAEYFDGFAQYERKAVIDESVRKALIADYQAEQTANLGTIKAGLWVLPLLFTVWLAAGRQKERARG